MTNLVPAASTMTRISDRSSPAELRRRREDLGLWLRRVRLGHGLSEDDVSEAIGLTPRFLMAQVEAGKTRVASRYWRPLAAKLGVVRGGLARRFLHAYDPELFDLMFPFLSVWDPLAVHVSTPNQSVASDGMANLPEDRHAAGVWLRDYRLAAGISQQDLARACGFVSSASIDDVESGADQLPRDTWWLVTDKLSIPRSEVPRHLLRWYDPEAYWLSMLGVVQVLKPTKIS